MKGLFVLLCALVAAQARSTGVQSSRAAAALGENPGVVHLRVAIGTSGLLNSCVGSLIDHRWVLTSSECTNNHRFIWVRYGVVNVISPSLVTENSAVTTNSQLGLSLISINRNVLYTDTIAAVSIARSDAAVPASGRFCGFGANENGGAGEVLSCSEVDVEVQEDGTLVADAGATQFDLGAPLVVDGVQYGVLVQAGERNVFVNAATARDWIEQVTGLSLGPESEEDASESNGVSEEDNTEEDSGDSNSNEELVNFVN